MKVLAFSRAGIFGRMHTGMELLVDLDAFYLEHRRCGELESEVSEGESGWIVMACSYDGQLAQRLTSEESLNR